MLALEAAKAQGGRMPLATLLEAAIRHARDGYVVTRSQARLTAEKLGELEKVPGFAATFLADGKPPDAGTCAPRRRWPPPSIISPRPGSAISTAAMSAARSPPIWSGSAAR